MAKVKCIMCVSGVVDQNDPDAKWTQMCPRCLAKLKKQAETYTSPKIEVREPAKTGK